MRDTDLHCEFQVKLDLSAVTSFKIVDFQEIRFTVTEYLLYTININIVLSKLYYIVCIICHHALYSTPKEGLT